MGSSKARALAVLLLLLAALLYPANAAFPGPGGSTRGGGWLQYRSNAQGTGATLSLITNDGRKTAWASLLSSFPVAASVVYSERHSLVYAGTLEGHVIAINAGCTGGSEWFDPGIAPLHRISLTHRPPLPLPTQHRGQPSSGSPLLSPLSSTTPRASSL
jgi:hypothetical protein